MDAASAISAQRTIAKKLRNFDIRVNPQDIFETAREAIKHLGRYAYIVLTAGSIPGSDHSFDDEVQVYIETLQAIGANFSTRRFPSQLIASAFDEKHLERIYEQTGLMSYTADLEVPDEELFNWICPGKARSVGYREWRRRLVAAVDIFGRGECQYLHRQRRSPGPAPWPFFRRRSP